LGKKVEGKLRIRFAYILLIAEALEKLLGKTLEIVSDETV